jgi:CheY-like chemotaxis protein
VNKDGPILIIEDDLDDQEMLTEVFHKLGYVNEILFFNNGQLALDFISKEDVYPFLILSDINMPKLNGLELKKKIHTDAQLQSKCIPYLFFTTSASRQSVIDAYSTSAQGFFIKDITGGELEKTIYFIVEYWRRCYSPNHYPK